MRCLRCGRPISPLRQLTDREYCSDDHRRRGPLPSASVLRDIEHEQDPFWDALHGQVAAQRRQAANTSLGAVLVLGVGLIVAARFWFPEEVSPLPSLPQIAVNPTGTTAAKEHVGPNGFLAWLQKLMPGDRPVVARESFDRGLRDWVAAGDHLAQNASWMVREGAAIPGRLKLWRPTLNSINYDVEFEGQIQRKAISWAFRAHDSANYYGTKILLRKPGEASGASIQRIIVAANHLQPGLELPLPITLHKDQAYQIAFTVHGNRFTTLIDGHVIDEWTDSRHKAGGVGFYSDEGESSTINWVHFTERKGLFSRLFSAHLLFVPPGYELE